MFCIRGRHEQKNPGCRKDNRQSVLPKPFKSRTFGSIHIRVCDGFSQAASQELLFSLVFLAELTFGQPFKFRTRQVIRADVGLFDLAHAFKNIYRKVIFAIFTIVFHSFRGC